MANAYLAYGLRVLADGAIPGFAAAPEWQAPDLRIYLNRTPNWFDGAADARYPGTENEQSHLAIHELRNEWWLLRYEDGTEFFIDPRGTEVWIGFRQDASAEDALTYLSGPIFAFLLRLRGTYCLHASVIDVGGVAVALTGSKGSGKSTTAAAFAKLGYGVLSDDLAPLTACGEHFAVQPGYPRLCLWPETATLLFGALPRIVPLNGGSDWWDKRYLDLSSDGFRFSCSALPLAAICVLDERSAAPDAPSIAPLPPRAALMHLVSNTYGARLLGRSDKVAAFELSGRLARCTPVCRVIPHQDPARLPQLCDVILREVAALTGPRLI